MNALTILARTPVTVPTLLEVTTASASSDLKGRIVRMVSTGIKMMFIEYFGLTKGDQGGIPMLLPIFHHG